MIKNCSECNQECCKSVIVEIDKPETLQDWEDIKWQVAHKNVRVLLDNEASWCIEFLTECDEMDENGRCKIYDKRPKMCREHSSENCIVNGYGDYHELLFECIQDVEDFLKKHPEAIGDEMTDVHTCPKCGTEFTDDDDPGVESEDEGEEEIYEGDGEEE